MASCLAGRYRRECEALNQPVNESLFTRLESCGADPSEVDLSCTGASGSDLLALTLALAPAAHRVTSLSLRGNKVDRRGAEALATLFCDASPGSPVLRCLDVSHNPGLGDAGLAALLPLLSVPSLRVLDISACGVSEAGLRNLGDRLERIPEVHITRLVLDPESCPQLQAQIEALLREREGEGGMSSARSYREFRWSETLHRAITTPFALPGPVARMQRESGSHARRHSAPLGSTTTSVTGSPPVRRQGPVVTRRQLEQKAVVASREASFIKQQQDTIDELLAKLALEHRANRNLKERLAARSQEIVDLQHKLEVATYGREKTFKEHFALQEMTHADVVQQLHSMRLTERKEFEEKERQYQEQLRLLDRKCTSLQDRLDKLGRRRPPPSNP